MTRRIGAPPGAPIWIELASSDMAGSMDKPAEQPGPDAWLVYLCSADAAATTDAAAAAGAMFKLRQK